MLLDIIIDIWSVIDSGPVIMSLIDGCSCRRPSLKLLSGFLITFALFIAIQTFVITSKLSFESGPSSIPNSSGLRSNKQQPYSLDAHSIGQILPDGTVTFTPEDFQAGRHDKYINLPNVPIDIHRNEVVQGLMNEVVPFPAEKLLHQAPTPPSTNAIVGLASYPHFMDGWRKLVGSLRTNGYIGHIIVGVNPNIPQIERDYLDKMGVTYYAIEVANCTSSIMDGVSTSTKNTVRAKCSLGLENLKLEWGRFEMARRWLHACKSCTGWSMVIDTRDIFFQSDPFALLGDASTAQYELQFVEEIASYTNTLPESTHRAVNIGQSDRYKVHVQPCYGREKVKAYELLQRPMLCSGTVIGNRNGIHRFLSVLVHEFHTNNKSKPQCKSPSTTDQWTMNYLYYKGQFGYIDKTKTLPWGTGPVLTVGKPCVNSAITDEGGDGTSQKDMMVFSEEDGLILNPHDNTVAPTLHQWDRCGKWIRPWFNEHKDLYMKKERSEDEAGVDWV